MGMLVTRDDEEGELDDLVSVIDQLMEQGSGHLTIDLDKSSDGVTVHRYSTTECGKTGACAQPTELADDDEQ